MKLAYVHLLSSIDEIAASLKPCEFILSLGFCNRALVVWSGVWYQLEQSGLPGFVLGSEEKTPLSAGCSGWMECCRF